MDVVGVLAAFAAILLVLEVMVVVVIVGAIFYFLRRGVIVGRQKAAPYIKQATDQVQQIETITADYSNRIESSQIEAISTLQGLQRGLRTLFRISD